MSYSKLRRFGAYAFILLLFFTACKDDSYLTNKPPVSDQSFTESFDNYQEAYNRGWRAINHSSPVGRKWYDVAETPIITSPNYVAIYFPEWNQAQFTLDSLQFGLSTPFPKRYWEDAYASQRASNGYVATSLASAEIINLTGPNSTFTINNWLVSPELTIQNGDKISFYTYCKGVARLQLWISETTTLDVGGTNLSVTGDFKHNIVDINPFYKDAATDPVNAFPDHWTKFEGTVRNLKGPVQGRFAFRYILQDGIPSSATTADELYNELHKSVIGIDAVSYSSAK